MKKFMDGWIHKPWAAWAVFSVGCVLVPVVFGMANGVSDPAWDWDSSWFGRVLAVPLLLLGLGLCLGAPFLSPTARGSRLGLSLGAFVVFVVLVLLLSVVSVFVFGTGVR